MVGSNSIYAEMLGLAILAYAVFKIRAVVVRLNPMPSDISRRLLPSFRRRRTWSRSSTGPVLPVGLFDRGFRIGGSLAAEIAGPYPQASLDFT
jgi:hypothetical protein